MPFIYKVRYFFINLIVLMFMMIPINSWAKLNKCTDSNGKVSFTDRACPKNSKKEDVKVKQRNTRTGKTGIGNYNKLYGKVDGWKIWKTSSKEHVTCVSVRPARGESQPRLSGFGIVTGGAGFYMHSNESGKPYFGFYGEHVYRRSSIAEVDNKIFSSTNDKGTVLSWEGKTVHFEITSGPYKNLYVDISNDSGSIDFTGVISAYDKMTECAYNIL